MTTLPLSPGLHALVPTFLTLLEQSLGLEKGALSSVPATSETLPQIQKVLLTSPVAQLLQPVLRTADHNDTIVALQVDLRLPNQSSYLIFRAAEGDGYDLKGYGFELNTSAKAAFQIDTAMFLNAYLRSPLMRYRLVLSRALAAFPAESPYVRQTREVLQTIITEEEARLQQMPNPAQVAATYTVAPGVLDDLPLFLEMVDTLFAELGYKLTPRFLDRWSARVASVGLKNITARDVMAVLRADNISVRMFGTLDHDKKQLVFVGLPLVLAGGGVVTVSIGGNVSRANLACDFAQLSIGNGTSAFQPDAFAQLETKVDNDEQMRVYRQLFRVLFDAFRVFAQADDEAERVRTRVLVFLSSELEFIE